MPQALECPHCGHKQAPPFGKGEQHHNSVLNTEQVLDIRRRYKDGETITELSRSYAVSKGAVSNIVKRRTWKHI